MDVPVFALRKIDTGRRLVFGWVSIAVTKSGAVVEDLEGDIIDLASLEDAVYDYNLVGREANALHQGETIGRLTESLVVTPEKLAALGLSTDALPHGWWAGFRIDDDAAWGKVQSGDYQMFSIEGTATREVIP